MAYMTFSLIFSEGLLEYLTTILVPDCFNDDYEARILLTALELLSRNGSSFSLRVAYSVLMNNFSSRMADYPGGF